MDDFKVHMSAEEADKMKAILLKPDDELTDEDMEYLQESLQWLELKKAKYAIVAKLLED